VPTLYNQAIIIALKMEAVSNSNDGLLHRDYTAYIPEGPNLHIRRRENLKSHKLGDIQGFK
jgi:hypothetical protein